MTQYLIIEPIGGLGNRLLALLSAKIYAESCGRDFAVSWRTDPELCPAEFEELFDNTWLVSEAIQRKYSKKALRVWLPEHLSALHTLMASGRQVVYLQCGLEFRPPGMDETDFARKLQQSFSDLEIVAEARMRSVVVPERCIGLQIRRQDHWRAWRYAPLGLFFQVMERELRRDARVSFFLATDSEKVIRACRARFGSKVLINEGLELRKDTASGVKDAMLDLRSLSQTHRIYASHMSTFGTLAARINNIPIRYLSLPGSPLHWLERRTDRWHEEFVCWDPERRRFHRKPPRARETRSTTVLSHIVYWHWRYICSDWYQVRRRPFQERTQSVLS